MTKTITKYSVFCHNKPPRQGIKTVCIYLNTGKQWILCKGRIYNDGKCRYWHNGHENVVNHFSYRNLENLTEEQCHEMVVNLNLKQLEYLYPKKEEYINPFNGARWYFNGFPEAQVVVDEARPNRENNQG